MKKSNEKIDSTNIENLLGCGCFQFFVFLCFQWAFLIQSCNTLFMAFAKAMPSQWTCLDGSESFAPFVNGTELNVTLQCEYINSPGGCQNFTWIGEFYSIVPHWQLVCDRVKYIYLIMTLEMLGALLATPVFGQLSDSYGRKWTLFGVFSLNLVSGAASAVSLNWQMLAILRFVMGFSSGGCIIINFVFLMEFITKKHRLWLSSITGLFLSYLLIAALAYGNPHWRKLTIVINLSGIPALGIILFVGESPRWLLQRGRSAEAEKQFRRIARINRQVLDEDDIEIVLKVITKPTRKKDILLESAKMELTPNPASPVDLNAQKSLKLKNANYTYYHLFATKALAVNTIILSISYFCISTIAGSITFNVDSLSGSIFVNFAIMGCIRWVTNIIVVAADLLIPKFGRRFGFVAPLLFICLCSFTVTLTQIFGSTLSHLKMVVSILSIIMDSLAASAWIMIYLSNTELFPTPIRNMALAFCAIWNRLGGVIAPQILFLGQVWKPAPFAVFAALSLVSGILFSVFIPETKGQPLPEKMFDFKTSSESIFANIRNLGSTNRYNDNNKVEACHIVAGNDKKMLSSEAQI